jgi:hypothetical protein
MEFKKLTKENLPEPNKLIWIKRKNGSIYLGYREDKPIATNKDSSRDCYWRANPSHSMLMADSSELRFRYNFSDVTVDSWAELDLP